MAQTPMHSLKALARALAAAFAAALVLAVPASAVSPVLLGPTIQHPIGVAALKDKLLITQECHEQILAMDKSGALSTYATLPSNPTCPEVEDYITVVPQDARPPWQPNDAYVMAGNHIYRVDQRGRVTTLSTGPCSVNTQAAIAFDRWGTWGGGLIGECGGSIYKVDATGRQTLVVNLGVYSEGAQVIPPGSVLPQYTGWLLVAEEFANNGQVEVVSPDGSQHIVVGQWPDAEHVEFVTKNPCVFGSTNSVFFSAYPSNSGGSLLAYPKSDFSGLAGKFVISGEDNQGLAVLNGPNDVTPFDLTHNSTNEGATFVDWSASCAV